MGVWMGDSGREIPRQLLLGGLLSCAGVERFTHLHDQQLLVLFDQLALESIGSTLGDRLCFGDQLLCEPECNEDEPKEVNGWAHARTCMYWMGGYADSLRGALRTERPQTPRRPNPESKHGCTQQPM